MPVDVRLPTVLRPQAGGQSTVVVEGSTIGDVLQDLVAATRAWPASSSTTTAPCTGS